VERPKSKGTKPIHVRTNVQPRWKLSKFTPIAGFFKWDLLFFNPSLPVFLKKSKCVAHFLKLTVKGRFEALRITLGRMSSSERNEILNKGGHLVVEWMDVGWMGGSRGQLVLWENNENMPIPKGN